MPQLNPSPWFFILVTSWLIILILLPSKILPHTNLNDPLPKASGTLKKTWTWPWL